MSMEQTQKICKTCQSIELHARPGTNHILHLLITVLLCGFWIPIWILSALKIGGWRCQKCGSEEGSGLTTMLAIILVFFGSLFAYNKCSNFTDDSPEEQSEQPGSLSMDEEAIDKVRDEMAKKRIAQHALDTRSNVKEDEIKTKDPEVTTEPKSDSTPDIPSEEPTIPEVRDIESLEGITLPVTLDVTVPFSLLNAAGKETSIPADTSILVVKRSPSGTLTMRIGDKLFVGNETRLAKKVRIPPN